MASFDENGKYIKTNWKAGDKITATKLNKIEESIEAVNDNDISRHVEADARLDALEAKDVAHDKEFTNVRNLIADNKAAAELGDYEINSRMTFLEQELNEGIEEVHNVASTVDGKIATAEANMTAQVNQGKADMEAMVAEVEADLEGLHAKDEELSEQVVHIEKKINNGIVYIKDFNNELLDDNAIIQNAFDFAKTNFESYTIIFESRDYEVNQGIKDISGKNVIINGNNANIHLAQNPDTKWYTFIGIPESANLISFNCFSLNIDAEQYGIHYNDKQGLFVFYVHANRVNINNCNLTNIYGSGINACGMVDIHDNYFYNCSGQNYGEHGLGYYDNYGDAIRISDEISKVGKVYNNYIVLDSDRRGRAGIVLEFDTTNIEVSYNYISGYDRGIHVELVENSIIRENTITNTDTGIILTDAPFTRIQGNKIYNLYENTDDPYKNAGIYLNVNFADSDICDNYIFGGSIADAIKVGNGEGVRFRNNIICGKIALSNPKNIIFIGNTLNNSNVDDKNILYAYNSNNITLENNIINNYKISFANGSNHTLLNNTFNSDGVNALIQLSNTSLYRINYNRFDVTGITTLISSYQPKQVGEFSGNIVYSDDSINLFNYGNVSAHQRHITKNDNIQIKSDNTIIKLDETYKVNNIFYGETLILHDANNVKYKVIVNTDGTIQSQKI